MELIIFASLYQEKKYFFLHPFFIELSIYVSCRSGVVFPSYKQDFGGRVRVRGPHDALRARLRKAESYILWLHSPYTPARSMRNSFKVESYVLWLHSPYHSSPTSSGRFAFPITLICTKDPFKDH